MSSKSSQTTSVSPEQRAAQATAMSYATNAANQPFQQYQGPWSAGYNANQTHGANMIAASANEGVNELNQASSGARSLQGFQPRLVNAQQTGAFGGDQFMSRYFNPFLQQVAGGMTSELGRARDMQIIRDEDKALAAGAYGGSRHGVMDSETTRGFFDTLGRNVGDLYARGFDTAAGLGQQDAQRFTDVGRANADRTLQADLGNQGAHTQAGQLRLGASGLLRDIGDTRHDNYLDSANSRFQAGNQMHLLDQARIDRDRERFNEWRDYPMRQSEIINRAAGLVQGGQTTTQTRSPGLAEIGLTLGAAALTGGLFPSDKNIKSGKRPVSDEKVLRGFKKMPGAQTWKYDPKKGGPRDPRRHVGPMAQDVKRNLGFGTGSAIPIQDMLGAQSAAISALARKVDDITDVKIKRMTKRKGK
jgi:hypothetical protein